MSYSPYNPQGSFTQYGEGRFSVPTAGAAATAGAAETTDDHHSANHGGADSPAHCAYVPETLDFAPSDGVPSPGATSPTHCANVPETHEFEPPGGRPSPVTTPNSATGALASQPPQPPPGMTICRRCKFAFENIIYAARHELNCGGSPDQEQDSNEWNTSRLCQDVVVPDDAVKRENYEHVSSSVNVAAKPPASVVTVSVDGNADVTRQGPAKRCRRKDASSVGSSTAPGGLPSPVTTPNSATGALASQPPQPPRGMTVCRRCKCFAFKDRKATLEHEFCCRAPPDQDQVSDEWHTCGSCQDVAFLVLNDAIKHECHEHEHVSSPVTVAAKPSASVDDAMTVSVDGKSPNSACSVTRKPPAKRFKLNDATSVGSSAAASRRRHEELDQFLATRQDEIDIRSVDEKTDVLLGFGTSQVPGPTKEWRKETCAIKSYRKQAEKIIEWEEAKDFRFLRLVKQKHVENLLSSLKGTGKRLVLYSKTLEKGGGDIYFVLDRIHPDSKTEECRKKLEPAKVTTEATKHQEIDRGLDNDLFKGSLGDVYLYVDGKLAHLKKEDGDGWRRVSGKLENILRETREGSFKTEVEKQEQKEKLKIAFNDMREKRRLRGGWSGGSEENGGDDDDYLGKNDNDDRGTGGAGSLSLSTRSDSPMNSSTTLATDEGSVGESMRQLTCAESSELKKVSVPSVIDCKDFSSFSDNLRGGDESTQLKASREHRSNVGSRGSGSHRSSETNIARLFQPSKTRKELELCEGNSVTEDATGSLTQAIAITHQGNNHPYSSRVADETALSSIFLEGMSCHSFNQALPRELELDGKDDIDIDDSSFASSAHVRGVQWRVACADFSIVVQPKWKKPSTTDVLSQRGGRNHRHTGTIAYRALGDSCKSAYQAMADSYGEKGTYTGSISNSTGMPHGYGRCTGHGQIYNYDGLYEGGLKNEHKHGHGIVKLADGRTFEGEVKGEMVEGKMTCEDGSEYKGIWGDDVRNGRGKCVFPDGSVYEGEFRDGELFGQGRMSWSDGSVYQGEWRNGKMHGVGKEMRPDGSIRHEGAWCKGRPAHEE